MELDEQASQDEIAVESARSHACCLPSACKWLTRIFLILALIFLSIYFWTLIFFAQRANHNKAIKHRNEIIENQSAICQFVQIVDERLCGDIGMTQYQYSVHSKKCDEEEPLFMWGICSFEPQEALNTPFSCQIEDCASGWVQLAQPSTSEVREEMPGQGFLCAGIVFASLFVCCCLCFYMDFSRLFFP